jgi:choice-of-anchor B domain-containing protein
MGLDDGTGFVDISDPENPMFLGKLLSATSKSIWRDIKVYKDHAFIVSEAENHGLQVFDLKKLRGVEEKKNFESDATLNTFGNAHNIAINEESGYAYVVGTSRADDYNGGVHFIDISAPKSPVEVGGHGDDGYSHDAHVVNYIGPDSNYTEREIFAGSNENRLVFVDVTDKENPSSISSLEYENVAYTHQGWFTEDHRFFIFGDELDEIQRGGNTRTIIVDIENLDDPKVHYFYYSPTPAIDHNGYVKGNTFFLANYTSGIRIIDISGISDKEMEEVGFFDTYPENNSTSFNGVWNVYPYFDSGIISISDSNSGLFLVKKSE